jgi:Ni/Fe-hydrogenase subunit HybB-like protein
MMSPEAISEFLPVDAFWVLVGFDISIPSICSGTFQLVRSKQNLLTVVALDHLQLLLNGLQLIICVHWFD